VLLAAVGYAGVCGYMALALTQPKRQPFGHTPEQYGLAYEPVAFPSRVDHVPLEGWLVPPQPAPPADAAPADGVAAGPDRRRPPIVLVHGRGGDRQDSAYGRTLEIAAHLARQGYPALLFDLRGSGRSGGTRYTLGAQEVRDVGGAIDLLERRGLAGDGVILLGYSMGASTAVLAAPGEAPGRVRAVVEDSGFADLGEILDMRGPRESGLPGIFTPGMVLMARPLMGVNAYAIRPVAAAPALAARGVPLLVIHGEADAFIPVRHGHRLAAAYGPRVETYFVPGADHTGGYKADPAAYLARLSAFLAGNA
jgi:pimeloyl-ACP methyl ester carboxylesterase